jgi:hypothetical protein
MWYIEVAVISKSNNLKNILLQKGPNDIEQANVPNCHLGLLSFMGSFFPKNMFS